VWGRTKNERIEFLESCREYQSQTNRSLCESLNYLFELYKKNREEDQVIFKELQNQINDLHLKLNIVQNLKLTNLQKGKKK
jgi:hypothetical protein